VAFAAVRLARFNVEHAQADFDYRTFHGIPSPGAACVMAALILFQAQMEPVARSIIVYSLPFVAVALAFLMVSRVPYRRFHRAYFLGKKPFSQVMTAVLLLAAFWLIKVHTLLLIVLWYAVSGPLFLLVQFVRERHRAATTVRASATPPVADSERKRA
jgi:CDP-diacylglycerol--serine O-phosphatidyltransferase